MVSTRNLESLPGIDALKKLCKAIAALEAIISPEWEYRYYSYDSQWAIGEECATMRDGEGDEYLILFNQAGAIINGLAHEAEQQQVSKENIPVEFHDFIFGEPVKSVGTTFCIWKKYDENQWHSAHNQSAQGNSYGDGSEDLLFILDENPKTYQKWAEEYYEGQLVEKLPLHTIKQMYDGAPLTREMVLALNPALDDWPKLMADLDEIAYPYVLG